MCIRDRCIRAPSRISENMLLHFHLFLRLLSNFGVSALVCVVVGSSNLWSGDGIRGVSRGEGIWLAVGWSNGWGSLRIWFMSYSPPQVWPLAASVIKVKPSKASSRWTDFNKYLFHPQENYIFNILGIKKQGKDKYTRILITTAIAVFGYLVGKASLTI